VETNEGSYNKTQSKGKENENDFSFRGDAVTIKLC
jgi:hypothetical protein